MSLELLPGEYAPSVETHARDSTQRRNHTTFQPIVFAKVRTLLVLSDDAPVFGSRQDLPQGGEATDPPPFRRQGVPCVHARGATR